MQFDTENALRDLDRRTNSYIRDEIFAHGDLTVRKHAIEVFKSLDTQRKSARVLIEMLKLSTSP